MIGNGTGRTMQGFDIKMIENHSGGLSRMRFKLMVNALYRDIKTDFLIAMNDDIVEEIAALIIAQIILLSS